MENIEERKKKILEKLNLLISTENNRYNLELLNYIKIIVDKKWELENINLKFFWNLFKETNTWERLSWEENISEEWKILAEKIFLDWTKFSQHLLKFFSEKNIEANYKVSANYIWNAIFNIKKNEKLDFDIYNKEEFDYFINRKILLKENTKLPDSFNMNFYLHAYVNDILEKKSEEENQEIKENIDETSGKIQKI